MMLYNIPAFDNVTEFLIEVARGKGRLKKVCLSALSSLGTSLTSFPPGRNPRRQRHCPLHPPRLGCRSHSLLHDSSRRPRPRQRRRSRRHRLHFDPRERLGDRRQQRYAPHLLCPRFRPRCPLRRGRCCRLWRRRLVDGRQGRADGGS